MKSVVKLMNFQRVNIVLVGLGGTGSFLVSSLLQLIASSEALKKGVSLTLVDGDRVENKNLRNQKYLPEDVGRLKAEVLYDRYHAVYPKVELDYVPRYLQTLEDLNTIFPMNQQIQRMDNWTLNILVGCVDNMKARRIFDEYFHQEKPFPVCSQYIYIDTGNGLGKALDGQMIVGYVKLKAKQSLGYTQPFPVENIQTVLRPASAFFPQILTEIDEENEPTCGVVTEESVQNLGANITSATGVFNVLNSILCFQTIPGNLFFFDAAINKMTKVS